jgi:hypothetical protein
VHALAERGSEAPGLIEPVAWRPVLAVAAAAMVVHSAVATRYGWHRDEFYYLAAGRRPAWGYPDQPPVTPLLARAAGATAGGVLPLRLVVIAFQGATIVVAALVAREVGGGRFAQVLTAGCVAGLAVFVGAALFLGTTPTDQFFWTLIFWLTLLALRTGTTRAWVATGLAAGVGLENKHTVAVLLAGVAIGLVVSRRRALRSPGPWIAAAIALVFWAPNLVWDAQHHWVTLDMARVIADDQGGTAGAVAQLPLLLLVFPGPLIVYLWIRGARWAARPGEGRTHVWLLVTAVIVVVGITIAGGKPYYAAPVLVPLFALGAVATERRGPAGAPVRRHAVWLVTASAVTAPLLSLPYYPPRVATALRPLAKESMETYGWPQVAREVADATARHPDAVAVYVSNYGEAGALDTYGRSYGLARPVVAGQNAYRVWGPPRGTPSEVIAVGEFSRSFLERSWADVRPIGRLSIGRDLTNEETANDATIYLCRRPRGSWAQLWSKLSYLS